MAATAPAKPPAPKRRNRKRKRRAASSSSSSSSFSSPSEDEPEPKEPIPAPSESSSSSESDSDSDSVPTRGRPEPTKNVAELPRVQTRQLPSPSPPPTAIPSFIPASGTAPANEQELKARFRKFWMASVADGFRDDLEEIRKEPNLGAARLSLLIDSLASGAEVFTSTSSKTSTNEMQLVLE
ncbi:uncharacterized protein BT62DRAFT_986568 [Guyanagaster necrorhizus]|uniref:Ribosome assembly protein 3 n=1 Tax=Guyanagaster necrorhizus TaxID=856835 RepID=A0A9P8AUU4_9AGAR|nr:uncharacterized protein BT62DRAFT_986568 [Guyanagaster necrorhizus MCA 3950]KAG7447262.1 hypothetical protein BT62DRAFT_986568 [Guyanagaster necrorhizus MCA 3950]